MKRTQDSWIRIKTLYSEVALKKKLKIDSATDFLRVSSHHSLFLNFSFLNLSDELCQIWNFNTCLMADSFYSTYSEVANKSVTFFILFWDFFPTYMALLGPTRLLISEKTSHLHCY